MTNGKNEQQIKTAKHLRRKRLTVIHLERVMGIEPTRPAWKAGILPLNYTRTLKLNNYTTPPAIWQAQIFAPKNCNRIVIVFSSAKAYNQR